MARNSEKAQSMLFRFRASQAAESGLLPSAGQRRPKAPSTISQIPLAEKWRGQVLKEVSRKITKIQDESLSDYQIRDLNDEINKLMKEKWSWERRIRELGGPNYMRSGVGGGVVFDDAGREVPGGGKGYRYFGRAKELPGVKEMFERAAKRRVKDKEGDKEGKREVIDRRGLDARYFGYGPDEEDGALLGYERKKEKEAVKRVGALEEEEDKDWEPLPGDAGDGVRWRLPTLDEVQEELMARKRRTILDNLG